MSTLSPPLPINDPDAARLTSEPIVVARVRRRARRYVLWLEHMWATAPGSVGLSISPEEVQRILIDPADIGHAERTFYEEDPDARALLDAIRDEDDAAAADPRVAQLRGSLGLTDAEIDLLSLAVSVEADPWLRRVFGYIHDDATHTLPTLWLARQLFQWEPGTWVGSDSALIRWRLARPADGQGNPWSVSAPWVADPFVTNFLVHGVAVDPLVGHAVRLVAPTRVPFADDCLYPAELEGVVSFVRALETADAPFARAIEVVVAGPRGAGKRTLASQACAALRRPLMIADTGVLAGPSVEPSAAREALTRVHRSARLSNAAVYWHAAEGTSIAWGESTHVPLSFLGTSTPLAQLPVDETIRHTVTMPPLNQTTRVAFWASLSSLPVPPPVLNWPVLPGDIVRAAVMAPAGPDAVTEACHATLRGDSAALARPMSRPYAWDDLVLPVSTREHLEEFEAQARFRWPVYEDWGFGRLCPTGRGIAALFAGPSGTGKTMTAQVLARSLGMEIYRVDLAGVMNKYIGETEKNLRRLFDACERANVLLFFDEADALFGQRTQVKDAHDRFANVEIDYLLQRMEEFDGVAILATNRKSDIDDAFVRRIRFIVDFLPPAVRERRALWRRALSARAPSGEVLLDEIDWDGLAERLTMTGADITNAAIGAAFLAHSEGSRIGMTHVMRASRRELAKRGVVVRAGDLER